VSGLPGERAAGLVRRKSRGAASSAGRFPADLNEFARRGSLTAIRNRLRRNPRAYVTHNADDPLTARHSILELKKTLGDHMVVFPYGGHLGNLWYPDNRELVRRILTAPAGAGARRGPQAARLGHSSGVPCDESDRVDTFLSRWH
jgi:pimeloyl-ACP methyl ester carboxylesterase